MQMSMIGADRSNLSLGENIFSRVFQPILFGASGEQQEHFAEMFGGSSADLVKNSWIGKLIGEKNVNWLYEGRSEEAETARKLVSQIQGDTGLKEDEVLKDVASLQVAFGGIEGNKGTAISNFIKSAEKLGVSATSMLSDVGNIAQMRGVLTGSSDFERLALGYAGLSQEEQQKMMIQAGRDYQKYGQWSSYLEGGNAEAYSLFTQLGGTNAAQTQAIQSIFAQTQMNGVDLTPELATSLAQTANSMAPFRAMDLAQMSTSMFQMGTGSFNSNFATLTQSLAARPFDFSGVGNYGTMSFADVTGAGTSTGSIADTMNFIKGVTSGNAYALSDYGRMANIGVLQSVDQNGLQTGLKDMSGLLLYA
jgi:hypothetical protein